MPRRWPTAFRRSDEHRLLGEQLLFPTLGFAAAPFNSFAAQGQGGWRTSTG
jgi:hypothetical protein